MKLRDIIVQFVDDNKLPFRVLMNSNDDYVMEPLRNQYYRPDTRGIIYDTTLRWHYDEYAALNIGSYKGGGKTDRCNITELDSTDPRFFQKLTDLIIVSCVGPEELKLCAPVAQRLSRTL